MRSIETATVTSPASIETAAVPVVAQGRGLDTATTPSAVLGVVLVKLRMDKEMSQADLAAAMGLSASTWSRIEKGDSGLSIDQLKQVSKVLGLSPGNILDLADLAEKEAIRQGIRIDQSATTIASLRAKSSPVAASIAAGIAAGSVASAAPLLPIFGIPLLGLISGVISIPSKLINKLHDYPDES